jgi:hypothetical protein
MISTFFSSIQDEIKKMLHKIKKTKMSVDGKKKIVQKLLHFAQLLAC